MRSSVYTDKALARNAGRFVWLSIDTENRFEKEIAGVDEVDGRHGP